VSADEAVDDLYRQPLGEFTRARNALAKSLGGADAKRVRALEKPTVVAWAVNQVYWRARAAFDRVMKAGAELRKAQLNALQGKAADVRGATDAHRRAIADAVAEADRIAADAGSKPSPDAVARTFEALSLAASPPDAPGRLTDALQPAGFEALAGITPTKSAAHGPAGPAHHARADAEPREARARAGHAAKAGARQDAKTARAREAEARKREAEEREAAAAARKREAELHKADAVVARAEATEKLARASWEHAHDALLEARRKRDELKRAR